MTDLASLRARLRAEGTLSLKIKVLPKSQQTGLVGILGDGSLKIKLAAVPEKGRANAELVAFLARAFEIAKTNVKIVTGETSPNKLVRLSL